MRTMSSPLTDGCVVVQRIPAGDRYRLVACVVFLPADGNEGDVAFFPIGDGMRSNEANERMDLVTDHFAVLAESVSCEDACLKFEDEAFIDSLVADEEPEGDEDEDEDEDEDLDEED